MKTGNKVITISFDDFLKEGILKENYFRAKVESIDWTIYTKKIVLIKGCSTAPIPTWAYMILVAKLTPYTYKILYGELCSAYEIYKNNS
tara:strand:- start:1334 stop:1600 length:267 start_codon:yes stop_codon:yes gene_type:complete